MLDNSINATGIIVPRQDPVTKDRALHVFTLLNLLAYVWIAALIACAALLLLFIFGVRGLEKKAEKARGRAAYAEYRRMDTAGRQAAYAAHKAAWKRVHRGGR
jgi:hypothetical protein